MTIENRFARFMRNTGPARMMVPLGLILIIFSVVLFSFNTDKYAETTGTITSAVQSDAGQEDEKGYDVKFTFTVDGKQYEDEFTNLSGSFAAGDAVKVFYDPADPSKTASSRMNKLIPVAIAGAGVLALAGGIALTVRAFRKSKELDKTAPAADVQTQAQLDALKTADGVNEYYFRFDGHSLKPGYIVEDADRNILYEGKMLKNSLVGARIYEFTDHRTGLSEQHEVGHVTTSSLNDEMFSVKSSFRFDGEKVWDRLHGQGIRLSTNMHSRFPYFIYDVTKDGKALARIESCSVYIHEDDEVKHKVKIPTGNMYYRFWTASDDLSSLFLLIFAISECEQTVVE
ncbi:DUF3592 domain-containing protein [Ruminococcus sp. FC2018]|uniref:DUF3592 domain-containing protein n=1 Tax=Ruminococcus sp. FC2018 TaxID=1410617 RepID=UPI00048C7BA8|nr:DUF3592 domain-containing protein [Ruminococcus sp. FC2018]